MSEIAELFKKLSLNTLGEALREITFVGEGLGCYKNFDVRSDAVPWSESENKSFKIKGLWPDDEGEIEGTGYTFNEGSLKIDVFWYWYSDGTLVFRIYHEDEKLFRALINTDCKKNTNWAQELI